MSLQKTPPQPPRSPRDKHTVTYWNFLPTKQQPHLWSFWGGVQGEEGYKGRGTVIQNCIARVSTYLHDNHENLDTDTLLTFPRFIFADLNFFFPSWCVQHRTQLCKWVWDTKHQSVDIWYIAFHFFPPASVVELLGITRMQTLLARVPI